MPPFTHVDTKLMMQAGTGYRHWSLQEERFFLFSKIQLSRIHVNWCESINVYICVYVRTDGSTLTVYVQRHLEGKKYTIAAGK